MPQQSEENFPRGGVKPSPSNVDSSLKQKNLFGVENTKKKSIDKINQPTHGQSVPNTNVQSSTLPTSAGTLSYKKLQEGMVIMACVKQIKSLSIEIEMPGLLYGDLLMKYISNPFIRELNKVLTSDENENVHLNDMFRVGQFVPAKIISVTNTEKGHKVLVSTNPADINLAMHHTDVKTGMLVWGAIAEKSDHCYFVDLGIKDCRAALSFTEVDDVGSLAIGKPLYFVVTKSDNCVQASTVAVSAKKEHIEATVLKRGSNVDHMLPGSQVGFIVEQILKDGLQGRYLDDRIGYVNEHQLQNPFDTLKKFHEHQKFTATLMYVQPTTKFAFFSLKPFNEDRKNMLDVRKSLTAKIIARDGRGCTLSILNKYKGCVSNRRLLKTLPWKDRRVEMVLKHYLVGSTHPCRIFEYNCIEDVYICTMEPDLVKENARVLQLGQKVEAKVTQIVNEGLVVRVGEAEGFITNMHLSNVQYSENIKKQFKVDKILKARVWALASDNENMKLTLKPDLVKSDENVLTPSATDIGTRCAGVVVKSGRNGVLVAIYGNVVGYLPKHHIPGLQNDDASRMFYTGQCIKCYVMQGVDHRLTFSMEEPKIICRAPFSIGEDLSEAKVVAVLPEGLELESNYLKTYLPQELIAVENLGERILRTYAVGDIVSNLLCVDRNEDGKKLPVVSRREGLARKKKELSLYSKMRRNKVYRSLFLMENDTGISVSIPQRDNKKECYIHNYQLQSNKDKIKFSPHQVIHAKVLSIENKKIELSARLSDVFDYNYKYSLNLLTTYLEDMDFLRDRLKQQNNPIAELSPGQIVKCVVAQYIKGKGCSVYVQLGNVYGLVQPHHCPDDIQPHTEVEGVILWIDYKNNCASVCLKKNIISKINTVQDGSIDQTSLAKTGYVHLLYLNEIIGVGVLSNEDARKQLVYFPVKLHENDFVPDVEYYKNKFNEVMKVVFHGKVHNRLLAIEKSKKRQMDKAFLRNSNRKEVNKNGEVKVKVAKPNKKKQLKAAEEVKTDEISEVTESSNNDVIIESVNDESDMEMIESETEPDSDSQRKRKLDVVLPGVGEFFAEPHSEELKDSSDDEKSEEQSPRKKRKLTNAERKELNKRAEEEIRAVETTLADPTQMPKSAEHFNRVLLGNPDNSEVWVRYIAFHAEATEFEKARSVAKYALEKISHTAEQDRLNVTLAYLNLENMYGTKESFNKIFEEAVRTNDALTVYLATINMLADMAKFDEMNEKIKKVRAKFPQSQKTWLTLGKLYYKLNQLADARRLKDSALTTVTDTKTRVTLAVQFAALEMAHGEDSVGEAMFETILQSDPRRVDIWCTYVDQLEKKKKYDSARNVLQRAVGQKLAYKKMRVLFKKYHQFEKNHGTPETIEEVRKSIADFFGEEE